MSNVILRVTVPRLVAALPLWLLAGVWVSFAFPEIPLSGLRLGSLVWLAILMLQPVPAVLRYSVGVRRSGLSILALLLLFYSLAGAAGGMVYLVVMRAAWGWQVAACAVIGLVSWGIGTVYQRYLEPRLDMVMSWEIGNRQRDQRRV